MKEDLINRMNDSIAMKKNWIEYLNNKTTLNHFEEKELIKYDSYIKAYTNVINYLEKNY